MAESHADDGGDGRYARALAALEAFDAGGYLMYLDMEIGEKREEEEGLTEDEELLVDIWRNEWGGSDPQTVGELKTWLTYKQYVDYLPTVEDDLSRHQKCLSCGSATYVTDDRRSCGCPVGFRDGTWYDCQDCGDEYIDSQTPDAVPLCKSCFRTQLNRAQQHEA